MTENHVEMSNSERLATIEEDAVARLKVNLGHWDTFLRYWELTREKDSKLRIGPVTLLEQYSRTRFRMRQKSAEQLSNTVAKNSPEGIVVRALLPMRIRKKLDRTFELIWWFSSPLENTSSGIRSLTDIDLEAELQDMVQYGNYSASAVARIVVIAAPKWDDSVKDRLEIGLTRLREQQVVGLGLASLAGRKLWKTNSASDRLDLEKFGFELLHPLTNNLAEQLLSEQCRSNHPHPLWLDKKIASELSIASWRLVGIAQDMVSNQPDQFQIVSDLDGKRLKRREE